MSWTSTILYPSQPATPSAPTVGSASGSGWSATTYYIKVTFTTPYGETLASSYTSDVITTGNVPTVTSPIQPSAAIPITGYNVYISTTSGGTYYEQNSSPIAFGTNWTGPGTGLVSSGTTPITTWGTTLTFQHPERDVTGFDLQWYGHDELSSDGHQQSITQFVDQQASLTMPFVILGSDLTAWKTFLQNYGIQRVPFDLTFTDNNPGTGTYTITDKRITAKYVSMSLYSFTLTMRQVVV